MKIKNGFIIREIAGSYVIIAAGEDAVDFGGMITVNETGAFLWGLLERGTSKKEMTEKLLSEYDVDEKTAEADIDEFIEKLRAGKILADDE